MTKQGSSIDVRTRIGGNVWMMVSAMNFARGMAEVVAMAGTPEADARPLRRAHAFIQNVLNSGVRPLQALIDEVLDESIPVCFLASFANVSESEVHGWIRDGWVKSTQTMAGPMVRRREVAEATSVLVSGAGIQLPGFMIDEEAFRGPAQVQGENGEVLVSVLHLPAAPWVVRPEPTRRGRTPHSERARN
jgi:hypothetical protein